MYLVNSQHCRALGHVSHQWQRKQIVWELWWLCSVQLVALQCSAAGFLMWTEGRQQSSVKQQMFYTAAVTLISWAESSSLYETSNRNQKKKKKREVALVEQVNRLRLMYSLFLISILLFLISCRFNNCYNCIWMSFYNVCLLHSLLDAFDVFCLAPWIDFCPHPQHNPTQK